MNATTLYARLSREVLMIDEETSDTYFSDFMRNDKGFYKLRTLLLCRSCRELCVEPYSSEFCQHLTCKKCFESNQPRNAGCKWCRVGENLSFDLNSQILVGLYKNLCAILFQYLSSSDDTDTGLSPEKAKLLKFLKEGCVAPTVYESSKKTKDKSRDRSEQNEDSSEKSPSESVDQNPARCPPCCCKCEKNSDVQSSTKSSSEDAVQVTAAESSAYSSNLLIVPSPGRLSDNVSSTVPDNIVPVQKDFNPDEKNQNKYGGLHNERTAASSRLLSGEFCKTLSSLALKGRKNRNIFEKFGLALSPPLQSDTDPNHTDSQIEEDSSPRKSRKRKTRETSPVTNITEPPLKPFSLKLKVKKVTNDDATSSYKVQYSNLPEEIRSSDDDHDDETSKNVEKPHVVKSDDTTIISSDSDVSVVRPVGRKIKRKATFIRDYSIFSSDSDFEDFKGPRKKEPIKPPKERDVCGCGAGSKVKNFTDICKRSRCPCYSQGRACVDCKCRFCSNPFQLDDEIEEESSSSESSEDELIDHNLRDDDHVDVES